MKYFRRIIAVRNLINYYFLANIVFAKYSITIYQYIIVPARDIRWVLLPTYTSLAKYGLRGVNIFIFQKCGWNYVWQIKIITRIYELNTHISHQKRVNWKEEMYMYNFKDICIKFKTDGLLHINSSVVYRCEVSTCKR